MFVKISDAENEVMEVVWEKNDWIGITEILNNLSDSKKWVYNTVATFAFRLSKKGFLECKKEGKANLFKALITEEEYKKSETRHFLQTIHGGSKRSLIASLYEGEIPNEKIDELLKILDEGKP